MKAVLIDDEAAALSSLSDLLTEFCPTVEVLGTANDVPAGLDLIQRAEPELIFLDIQMPGKTGFDLLRALPETTRPEVIFVTSQEDQALRALNCAALGYVLKPIELSDLLRAVRRVEQQISNRSIAARVDTLLTNLDQPQRRPKRIGVPSESGVDFVEVDRIVRCEGLDRCTRILLTGGKPLVSSYSIGEYRQMLEGYDFMVVHRSHLVNPDHIVRYDRSGFLSFTDGSTAPVSRQKRKEVLEQLSGRTK